jgi:phosphoribosyl-AMP cyclohydrolase
VDENKSIEETLQFRPQFDAGGLMPVIAQDQETGEVLMVAYMNAEALAETVRTGSATYFSRSRRRLWTKGQESGHTQKVEQILVDCDQDCLVLKVRARGGQCHAGFNNCFYRRIKPGESERLEFVKNRVFDPEKVYGRKE